MEIQIARSKTSIKLQCNWGHLNITRWSLLILGKQVRRASADVQNHIHCQILYALCMFLNTGHSYYKLISVYKISEALKLPLPVIHKLKGLNALKACASMSFHCSVFPTNTKRLESKTYHQFYCLYLEMAVCSDHLLTNNDK